MAEQSVKDPIKEVNAENWMPLESNPEILNAYLEALGFETIKYKIQELYSHEEWAQEMVPKPCLALLFLYPLSEKALQHQDQNIKESMKNEKFNDINGVYFIRQFAQNACGTVGLMNAIYNVMEKDPQMVREDSFLTRFYEQTKNQDYKQIAENFKQSQELKQQHINFAAQGQSQQQVSQTGMVTCGSHFICFIEKNNRLYKMDGLEEMPLLQKELENPDQFLSEACKLCQQYMQSDPEQVNFSMLVLARTDLEQ